MQVRELADRLSTRDEHRIYTRLGDLSLSDDATTLRLMDRGESLYLDEHGTALLGRYLKIPGPYLKSCPADFRAQTLRYWMGRHEDADTVLETLGDSLIGVHSPDLLMLPLEEVGAMISRVFAPDAEVRTLLRDDRCLHVDVTTSAHSIEVPNPNRVPGRPEVGDITEGGVRFLAYPNRAKAPVVSSYLHRLVCTNGLTTDLKAGQITLKGRTVPEVLMEMEIAATEILGTLDESLRGYAATAQMATPGTPLAFATQLMREANLPVRVREAVTDNINQLPANASIYDVANVLTSVANGGVTYPTMLALQQLGGSLSFDTDRMIERCSTCERLF